MHSKKVVVAMSGGIDSAVCAAILKDSGFDVIGATMQLRESVKDTDEHYGIARSEDAKKIAHKLRIPHYVVNFRGIFKEKVITNFCEQYKRARTPNPCIRCNKYIKFGALLKKVKDLDADYIATGHYARIEFDNQRKRYLLKKGIDSQKDQSYFLYTLSQRQLKQTLLPLGKLTKKQVKQIAKKKGLPVANNSESQEICFISDNDYGRFIKENISEEIKPGSIVNTKGEVIGEHRGIIFYTVGQREGIGIADKTPFYVISINRKDNTIVVGKREDVYNDKLIVGNVNFIYMDKLKTPIKVEVKVRYLHPPASATIIPQDKGRVRVKFNQPQWAVAPGQAAVFYLPCGKQGKKDIVIGGGMILRS